MSARLRSRAAASAGELEAHRRSDLSQAHVAARVERIAALADVAVDDDEAVAEIVGVSRVPLPYVRPEPLR